MKLRCWFIFLLIATFSRAFAGTNTDTLSIAKSFMQSGEYKKAETFLLRFHQSHPNDLNTLWLYGQAAYSAKQFKKFNAAYSEAIQKFPANYYLKLDYAIKLVDNGDVKKASPLLETYYNYDSSSADLKAALAKIEYWQGYYNKALQTLAKRKPIKADKEDIPELKQDILLAKSSWLVIKGSYSRDDQPLQTIAPTIEAGTYFHPLLMPYVSVTAPLFIQSSNSASFQAAAVGDKLTLFKAGININVNGGFALLPDKAKTWTANAEITKTCFKYLQFYGQFAHRPYLTTLSSISSTITPYHYALNVGWNNPNSWNGKLVSCVDQFVTDNNYVYSLGGWIFTPPLKLSYLKLRVGYAYGYSSSKENRFIAAQPLSTIITDYSTSPGITGIYNPYFTPDNQRVNSALINISYSPRKQILTGINASIGFWATAENPYLFLDKDSNGNTFINRGYSMVNFQPDEISAFILYQFTGRLSIKADYTFSHNYFYTSNRVGITLKVNFLNEQKSK